MPKLCRRRCIVNGCNGSDETGQKLTLFAFPRCLKQRNEWLNVLNLTESDIDWSCQICVRHFDEDQLFRKGPKFVRLKLDAVPSLSLLTRFDQNGKLVQGGQRKVLRPYQCTACTATFWVKQHLLEHLEYAHSQMKVFIPCDVPPEYQLPTSSTIITGIIKVTNILLCDEFCVIPLEENVDFTSASSSSRSDKFLKRKVRRIGLFECQYCTRKWSTQRDLKAHVEMHTGGVKRCICAKCGQCFLRKGSTFRRHLNSHYNNRERIECTKCDRNFTSNTMLTLHRKRLHKEDFAYNDSKMRKMELIDYQSAITIEAHGSETINPEDDNGCKKDLKRPIEDNKMLKMEDLPVDESGISNAISIVTSASEDNEQSTATSLLSSGAKFGNTSCPYCSYVVKWPCLLTRHLRTHTGEKPFKCDQCDARFSTKAILKNHANRHLDVAPYPCQDCSKTFMSLKAYRYHFVKTHSVYAAKRFSCDECGIKFGANDRFKRHLTTAAHKNAVMKKFTSQSAL